MNKNNQSPDMGKLSEPFKALIGNQSINLYVYDSLPTPMLISSTDGACIFINQAWADMVNVKDKSLVVGKYRILEDPITCGILGQEVIDKLFRGEAVFFPDFPAPIDDVLQRGVIDKKPWDAATMDWTFTPIWEGDTFLYMILSASIKNIYYGKPEIVKAKKYIDEHWLDEFDADVVAKAVNVSPRYLRLLFQNSTDGTMFDYYKSVKVEHIKEKLADKNMTVAEAFSFCGVDSRGRFGKIFKQITGMTPTEYKGSLK